MVREECGGRQSRQPAQQRCGRNGAKRGSRLEGSGGMQSQLQAVWCDGAASTHSPRRPAGVSPCFLSSRPLLVLVDRVREQAGGQEGRAGVVGGG